MKKIKDNRRGSTLVEVIVTFALIGMFLLAATTAVSAAMNAFYRMESLSRAIVVSDTILDKGTRRAFISKCRWSIALSGW